jgi:hypothetical protein
MLNVQDFSRADVGREDNVVLGKIERIDVTSLFRAS